MASMLLKGDEKTPEMISTYLALLSAHDVECPEQPGSWVPVAGMLSKVRF